MKAIVREAGPAREVVVSPSRGDGIRARLSHAVPRRVRRVLGNPWVHGGIVLAALLLYMSSVSSLDYNLYVTELVVVYVIAAIGLNIPGGMVGALSLGHGGAFALGMYASGIVASNHGWPVWGTLPLALAFGAGVGFLMGAPAGRLGAIGLAMVSLGYAIVIGDLILQFSSLTGGTGGLVNIVLRFGIGADSQAPTWAVPAVIFVLGFLVYVGHWYYRSSRFGRASLATRDEPIGASALGISTYRVMLGSFIVGSAVGALAGALFGYLSLIVTPSTVSPALSILFLVMVVLGGAGSRLGPVIGAIVLTIVPLQLDQYAHVNTIIYGALLVLVVLFMPRGIISRSTAEAANPFVSRRRRAAEGVLRDAARERRGFRSPPAPHRDRAVGSPEAPAAAGAPILVAERLGRSFGEVRALDDVGLTIRAGEVVGLIGPNGSGKTTLLNVLSGLYPAETGSVKLGGIEISRRPPQQIADLGLGRTFQTPKLFPSLSIAEHLAVAAEHRRHDVRPEESEEARQTARALLQLGGLDPDGEGALDRPAAGLSQGQLRFLEVAVAAYRAPRVLLLDEPAAGLSAGDIIGLETSARRLADHGVGVVIVEHHLDLVRRLVDRIVVLHLGRVLWQGHPSEMDSADAVRTAYLGIKA